MSVRDELWAATVSREVVVVIRTHCMRYDAAGGVRAHANRDAPREGVVTWPHTLQERGPFACPRCGAGIRFVTRDGLVHDRSEPVCTWLDEASDEQVEGLK